MAKKFTGYRAKRYTVSRKARKAGRKTLIKYRRAAATAVRPRTSVTLGKGFPKRLTFTHKYDEHFDLTSTGGIINNFVYSCNSLYDPNVTSTGHQPIYFDQLTALYDHYTVIGAKATFTVTPLTANATGFWIGAYVDDDANTAVVTGISTLAEQTTAKVVQVAPNANNTYRLTLKWSAKKVFGGSILGNNRLQGTAIASPTENQNFVISVQGFGNTDVTVKVKAHIEYIAVWKELREVAQS